jgi:outer membrane protein OmpA-like peptidoglycan-associated protein
MVTMALSSGAALVPGRAHAQASVAVAASAEAPPTATAAATSAAPAESQQPTAVDHWWFGGYYRHQWIPSYMTSAFFARAPSVSNNGFGFTATYRTGGGLNVELGFGHMPYHFHGPFLAKDSDVTDTELIKSGIDLWHVTSSLLWDIEFHKTVALEIGFGIDVGVLTGHVMRNEAYVDAAGHFANCVGPLNPATLGPPDAMGQRIPYCNVPENGSYNPTTGTYQSDNPDAKGEQYNVKDNHVPPVMLFPMVPHLGLRIQPIKYLAIKAEFAFGVVQMWAGVSLQVNFGFAKSSPPPAVVAPPPVALAPVTGNGRVLGSVIDDETKTPVAGAIVKLQGGRALSPLTTESDGRFVIDRLDAGTARFEVEHPDYTAARCEAQIPAQGGDVPVVCHLTPGVRTGAISGQVQSEAGFPVAAAAIELSGPQPSSLKGDERGLFAAVDLAAGSYRLRIEADGYLVQVVEVTVEPHQTAMPQIILVKQPKHASVELRKEEIVITQQIQFKPASAEILGESSGVLQQVSDVLLRHPEIDQLEVQGHTDSRGAHDMNQQLSQARAESVRDWLVKAGIGAGRLQAVGYGPDHPIRPNDTAKNRALNRRVQFIIRK